VTRGHDVCERLQNLGFFLYDIFQCDRNIGLDTISRKIEKDLRLTFSLRQGWGVLLLFVKDPMTFE